MVNRCLSTDDLLRLTEYDRPADLCKSLDAQGIRYFKGKGGKPWTTLDLINAAAGLASANVGPAPAMHNLDDF